MLAGILDTALLMVITGLSVAGLLWLSNIMGWRDALGLALAIGIAAFGYLSAVAYFVLCELLMDGQSPGKRLGGLRVVRLDGTPIQLLDSALRNMLRAVDMLPFFYTVGLVAIFVSGRSQRVGDMVAGTMVIKERLTEDRLQSLATADWSPPPDEGLPTAPRARLQAAVPSLPSAERLAITRFVQRRHELPSEVRSRLAHDLVTHLGDHLPTALASDYDSPEALLVALDDALQQMRL